MRSHDELPPPQPQPQPQPQRRIGVLELTYPRSQLADVLQSIGALASWPYAPDIPVPTSGAITRSKELVLAVGPLTEAGPRRVLVAPSVKGGVTVTFILRSGHDVTVAAMNNQTTLLLLGKSWTGELRSEHVSHAEAIERVRALRRQ